MITIYFRAFSRVIASNRVQTVTIGADPSVARSNSVRANPSAARLNFIATAKSYKNAVANSKFSYDAKSRNTVARSGLVWNANYDDANKNDDLYKQIKPVSGQVNYIIRKSFKLLKYLYSFLECLTRSPS